MTFNQMRTLDVTVIGYPEPVITWFHNGKSLHCSGNFIETNGSGIYTCVAENIAGSATSFCKVTVHQRKQPDEDGLQAQGKYHTVHKFCFVLNV